MEATQQPTRTIVGGASLDTPERARAYIAAVQRDLNVHLRRLGSPTVLAVDGEWDADTQLAFERVCRILGVEPSATSRTFRLIGASAADRTDAESSARRRTAWPSSSSSRRSSARRQRRPPHDAASASGPSSAAARCQGRPRRGLRRRAPARSQPPPDHARLADGPGGRRQVGSRHRRRVPARLPRARPRGHAQRADVPRDRGRRRAADRRRARARRGGRRRRTQKELRHHFAHAPVPEPPKPKPEPASRRHRRAGAALRAAGARYEDAIVREARRHGVPVSLVCAVLEVETGFQNVFGHDAVRNPVKSPPRGLLAVTEERYKQYLHFRRQGLGNQGVGPMQLTSPGLQDRADALGGCWKVDPNIRVGVEYLAGNIQRLGLYRGVSPTTARPPTPTRCAAGEKKWRAKLGGDGTADDGGGSGPRTLKVRNPRDARLGRRALQKLVNKRFAEWKVGVRGSTRTASTGPRRARPRAASPTGSALASDYDARHHARAALQDAPAEPPHARRARARRGAPAVAAQAAPRPAAPRERQLPARRARADHRHAATTARTRAATGSPTTRSTSGSPTGTPVIALDDGVIVKTFKSPSGVTAGWQVTLRGATTPGSTGTEHGQRARRRARAQGTDDRHFGLRQRRAPSPHRTAGRTAAIPVRSDGRRTRIEIDDDDAVLEGGPLDERALRSAAPSSPRPMPALVTEQDLDALFGEDEDEEDLGDDDLDLDDDATAAAPTTPARSRASPSASRASRSSRPPQQSQPRAAPRAPQGDGRHRRRGRRRLHPDRAAARRRDRTSPEVASGDRRRRRRARRARRRLGHAERRSEIVTEAPEAD